MEVQSSGTTGQRPATPAWPMTAPMPLPIWVIEVGLKCRGGGTVPAAVGDSEVRGCGTGVEEREVGVPPPVLLLTVGAGGETGSTGTDRRLAAVLPGCCRWGSTRGRDTKAAITTAAPAADAIARVAFRRRARFLIRPKLPGGGASGSISASSQASISSRGLLTGISQCGSQARARVIKVRLDRSFRPSEHRGYLADSQVGVVVQQEWAAQPLRQRLDQGTYVHILGREVGRVSRGGGRQGPDGPPLAARLAPVIPDQVRGDHVEIALRAV